MKAAVEIADTFLEDGLILEVRARRQPDSSVFSADAEQLLKGIPIAILVDRRTAWASEIVAGTLKKPGRAIVIGSSPGPYSCVVA